jgi:glycylpeptide N-tetradecanoyltransferase
MCDEMHQGSTVQDVQQLMRRINLVEQASAAQTNRSAPKSEEEAASRHQWKFWQTQPVPTIGEKIDSESNGPVEPNKPKEELQQETYRLPEGFCWDEVDVDNPEQVGHPIDLFFADHFFSLA